MGWVALRPRSGPVIPRPQLSHVIRPKHLTDTLASLLPELFNKIGMFRQTTRLVKVGRTVPTHDCSFLAWCASGSSPVFTGRLCRARLRVWLRRVARRLRWTRLRIILETSAATNLQDKQRSLFFYGRSAPGFVFISNPPRASLNTKTTFFKIVFFMASTVRFAPIFSEVDQFQGHVAKFFSPFSFLGI